MIRVLIILGFVLATIHGKAQEVYNHQYSSVPDTARFEIVQSERGIRHTFKIDKYKGEVFQLVLSADDKLTWQSLGLGPMSDLALDAALEIVSEMSSEQIEELSKKNIDELSEVDFESNKFNEFSIKRVNFQLFMSGLGIRHTYLMHIHSGKTWQLVKDTETDQLFWSLIE